MSEGTAEVETVAAAAPVRRNTWASAARPPAPDGYRYSHRWIVVPETDVLTRGRSSRVWGYNARTLARLLGIKTAKVQQAVNAGEFQPQDLGSVIRWVIGRMRPGEPGASELPPLWRAYDGFTLLAIGKAAWASPSTSKLIPLAVQMPVNTVSEDVVRTLWGHRSKFRGFVGTSYALARLLLEFDGIDPDGLEPMFFRDKLRRPHRYVIGTAMTLRKLVKRGILTFDPETSAWGWGPFPTDLDGMLAGLRGEGFEQAEIVGRHIAIDRDLFSYKAAHRLLSYMRTNRVKAANCGRDLRLWIICNMDRVMHGYRERQIFRRATPPSDAPAGSGPRP